MTEYNDFDDPFDDTMEGEWRPRHARNPVDDQRNSAEYRALRREFLRQAAAHRNSDGTYGVVCALCGKPVNYHLRWPHAMCATIDHRVPVRLGVVPVLEISNWRVAHNRCNGSRARRLEDERSAIGIPSEKW